MWRELKILFDDLDLRYFGGRLTAAGYRVEVAWVDRNIDPTDTDRPPAFGDNIGCCYPFMRLINIDRSVRDPVELRETLLHEMIHASVGLNRRPRKNEKEHGAAFYREMARLYLECSAAKEPNLVDYSWLSIEMDERGYRDL